MIIANISPAQEHAAETASTLAFASRAKCIRNSAVVNQDVRGDAELMRRELERLQRYINLCAVYQDIDFADPHDTLKQHSCFWSQC